MNTIVNISIVGVHTLAHIHIHSTYRLRLCLCVTIDGFAELLQALFDSLTQRYFNFSVHLRHQCPPLALHLSRACRELSRMRVDECTCTHVKHELPDWCARYAWY